MIGFIYKKKKKVGLYYNQDALKDVQYASSIHAEKSAILDKPRG